MVEIHPVRNHSDHVFGLAQRALFTSKKLGRFFFMPLAQRLAELVQACFTGIWIESHEHEDALAEIAALCRQEQWRLITWDIDQGLKLRMVNETQAVEAG